MAFSKLIGKLSPKKDVGESPEHLAATDNVGKASETSTPYNASINHSTDADIQHHDHVAVEAEKPKVKLFSRPGKIGTSKEKDGRSGALPSPSKMGSYSLAGLQRGNMSTTSKNCSVLILMGLSTGRHIHSEGYP